MPGIRKKCTATYRGSACAALRYTYGLENDPREDEDMRLIDGNKAEAVLRNIAEHLKEAGNTDLYAAIYAAADVIKRQRTIDPESLRPRGRWECQEGDFSDLWRCTACGEDWFFEYDPTDPETKVNYCPDCGAKMEG